MNKRSTARSGPSSRTRAALKKKKSEEEEEGIPDELMFLILVRLSIKCLLRFKSVSKYWFKLISSSDFIKLYLQKSCGDPSYSYHKLLYMTRNHADYVLTFKNAPLYPTLCKPNLHAKLQVDMSHPIKFLPGEESLEFVGSCNGLVCLTDCKDKVLVWNPAIRKCIRLPSLGCRSSIFYGFGYDELSDDYIVVGICKTQAKMYSSRTCSWKKVTDNSELNKVDRNGCFLNGKLHWATKKNIFTIDLSRKLHGVMEPPNCVQECTDWKVHVVGEYLVVFCYYRLSHVDMWMMMRYGEKESWDKANKRYPLDTFYDPQTCFRHIPCFLHEGKILLHRLYLFPTDAQRRLGETSWRLIPTRTPTTMRMTKCGMCAYLIYNHKDDIYCYNNPRVLISKLPLPNLPVIVYVESLIWPFP